MPARGAPVPSTKIIHDTVHGPIPLSGVLLKLLEAPQVQRLAGVRQLGLAYLVWPGANHTRLEHVVGVAYTARRIAEQVGATPAERHLVEAAGLLHDVGHWPFSHTLEALIHDRFGVDHQDISRQLIMEEGEFRWGRGRSLRAIIEEAGLAPEDVADLVATPPGPGSLSSLHDFAPDAPPKQKHRRALPGWLHQIVSGMCDADQMDYLRRDAHYTGVALGMIDIHRLVQTAAVADDTLVFDRSGLHAVEGMIVARDLMYSTVYFHRTARIAETMLERAVTEFHTDELRPIAQFTDGELLAAMRKKGGVAAEIGERLKFRQLYKRALQVNFDELDEGDMRRLERFTEPAARRQAEREVERACGLPPASVVIDVPPKALLKPGGKTSLAGLKILDGSKLRPITEMSSIARALQGRRMFDWALLVSCPKPHVERVGKAARRAVLG
jgi:HD superfamily phosphohydrolase